VAQRSRLRFAVLMDVAFSSFQEELRAGITSCADEFRFDVVFFGMSGFNSKYAEDLARASFFDFIGTSDFDGILSVTTTMTNEGSSGLLAERLSALRPLPLVSVGTSIIGEDMLCVDNRAGMREIMKHLVDCHHYRRFAYVSGPFDNYEAIARYETFQESLAEAGIMHESEWTYEGNFLMLSGYNAVEELLEIRGIKPQVIVCANDLMAFGVCSALADRGFQIPFDIAVTGFDDVNLEKTISHGITTVHQTLDTLGFSAMERVYQLATGQSVGVASSFAPPLRIRASCGCFDFRTRENSSGFPSSVQADVACLLGPLKDALRGLNRAELYRLWIMNLRDGLEKKRSSYEFEETLHALRAAVTVEASSDAIDILFSDLYASFLEECEHQGYLAYRKKNLMSERLNRLIDRLQNEVARDVSITGHEGTFREIAETLGARRFYFIRFGEAGKADSHPSLIFAGGSDLSAPSCNASAPWIPGPDSWFPPNAGNLVANLIHFENDRYGYFLLDNDIAVSSVYDNLRIRLSMISKDLHNIGKIYRLNGELTSQVQIRESAELKLKDALKLVERLSFNDELTGLYNRRGFFMFAEQNIKYFLREKMSFFVIYADLDGLKRINDEWGHNDGDLAIKHAADAFREAIRDSDIVARIGGDEFTMLVSKANPPTFDMVKQRIIESFERKNREIGKPWTLSVSIGHFFAQSECDLSLNAMLEMADIDLYREKARKRNLE